MSDRRAEVLALAETVGAARIVAELIRVGATWGCPREWAEQADAHFVPRVCPFVEWPENNAAWDAQYERQSAHCDNGERPGECWAQITLLRAQEATRDGDEGAYVKLRDGRLIPEDGPEYRRIMDEQRQCDRLLQAAAQEAKRDE